MNFAQPGLLALMLIVLLMAVLAVGLARWRVKARSAFAGSQTTRWRDTFSIAATIFLLEAAVLIVIAIAQPQWGSTELTREREGVDVVIVLDISQSMQGTDVEPTRLQLAQQQLSRLIEAERGNRFGLVIFAGSAILRSPLTTDTLAIKDLVTRAGGEMGLLRSGSDLGAALEQASLILSGSESAGKAVLVVSDGEDFAGNFEARGQIMRQDGILLLTAGVGTPQGSQLFDYNRLGTPVVKLDHNSGEPVVTRLNEENLKAAAAAANGRYLRLGGEQNLLSFREDLARLQRTSLGAETEQIPIQRFQIFVAAALGLLVASWFVPLRLGALRSLAARLRLRPQHSGAAMLLLALLTGACSGGESLYDLNRQANQSYEEGSYEEALTQYQELMARRPDLAELYYNASNALHRSGQFERAVQEAQQGLPPRDNAIGALTYYALGNHYFALEEYELAYDAYRSALLLDPADQDAKNNLELALLILTGESGEQPSEGNQPGGPNGESGDSGEPADPNQPGDPNQEQPPPEDPEGEAEPGGEATEPSTQPPPEPGMATDVQRQLEEALRGLNEDITLEEAQRILELLQQEQQGERLPGGGTTPFGPDY